MSADNRHFVKYPFVDPVSGKGVLLVVDREQPAWNGLFVEHGDCPDLARVSPELDAFYCAYCAWSGRISGAWAMDQHHQAEP